MERKEQERLEEILAMCAQYEEQIDSESKINSDNSPRSSSSERTKSDTTIAERQSVTDNQQQHRVSPPRTLTGLTTPYLTNFDDRLLVSTKPHSQLPGKDTKAKGPPLEVNQKPSNPIPSGLLMINHHCG